MLANEDFYGTVILRNYIFPPWAKGAISGITGKCRVRNTEEILGFRTHAPDVNWGVLITGEQVTHFVPGCEVRAVSRWDNEIPVGNNNPEIAELP